MNTNKLSGLTVTRLIVLTTTVLLSLLFLVFGCSDYQSAQVSSYTCKTSKVGNQTVITCPDGSTSIVSDGAQGQAGADGANGSDGATGAAGTNGSDGASCSVSQLAVGNVLAPNGGALIVCPSSSALVLNGSPGVAGHDGQPGTPGTPGTIITPVQFCAGFVQHYPSTFAESGLCINNKMFGVYSANDGFLAELPPGQYYSDGINSSCTFTIGANCTISH